MQSILSCTRGNKKKMNTTEKNTDELILCHRLNNVEQNNDPS